MYKALAIDDDAVYAERVIRTMASRGLTADLVRNEVEAIPKLRDQSVSYELIVVNVSRASRSWPAILERLQEACWHADRYFSPQFLCVSDREQEPQFELALENRGARYVYEG